MTMIGERLKTARVAANLSQVDVAVAVGISRSTLSKYETAGDIPGRETLMKLAKFYGVPMDYLAARTGDPIADGAIAARRANTDDEALMLWAFRELPADEANAHLNLILSRVKRDG